jgi:hypothetical protein
MPEDWPRKNSVQVKPFRFGAGMDSLPPKDLPYGARR